MRGTSPTLTQVLIDGHTVSSGDWFILDQLNAASRSVSTELFPAEMVDRIEVRKSSEADDPEGGTAGSVRSRDAHPAVLHERIFGQLQAGGVYGDASGKVGPDLNGLIN